MGFLDQLSYSFESHDLLVVLTLIILEGVLSFDNAAVLAAMVRRLPVHQRRKALLYGLGGAYAFRVLAILLAGFLIENAAVRIVGGAYLLYLMVRHLVSHLRKSEPHEDQVPRLGKFLGFSAFWSTIVMVELADLAFALDQIVVAVAMTEKVPLIIVAAMIAILALRLSAVYMIRLMDWFPPLEMLAYLAVGWVGAKLLVAEFFDWHVPKLVSIGVTLCLLALPLLVKAIMDAWRRPHKRLRDALETSGPPSAASGADRAPQPATEPAPAGIPEAPPGQTP